MYRLELEIKLEQSSKFEIYIQNAKEIFASDTPIRKI